MKLTYPTRLIQPWRYPELYWKAVSWVEQFNAEDARFETSCGISYINGTTYINELSFKHEEDLTAFKLKFPEFSYALD